MASLWSKTVLVLTQQLDAHADLVIAELKRRALPVVRFDTADFPQRATLIARNAQGSWQGALVCGERTRELERVASMLYRRPTPFELDPILSAASRQFASSEARMALGGLVRSVQHLRVYELLETLAGAYQTFVRRLGLSFAARDLVVTPDGRYVLLEANSTGQWAWIERATGLPICAALVDLLTAETKERERVYALSQ
jgi:hypothetical protein